MLTQQVSVPILLVVAMVIAQVQLYFCQWYVTVPKKMSLESDRENI